jgi:hypothetical protein
MCDARYVHYLLSSMSSSTLITSTTQDHDIYRVGLNDGGCGRVGVFLFFEHVSLSGGSRVMEFTGHHFQPKIQR